MKKLLLPILLFTSIATAQTREVRVYRDVILQKGGGIRFNFSGPVFAYCAYDLNILGVFRSKEGIHIQTDALARRTMGDPLCNLPDSTGSLTLFLGQLLPQPGIRNRKFKFQVFVDNKLKGVLGYSRNRALFTPLD